MPSGGGQQAFEHDAKIIEGDEWEVLSCERRRRGGEIEVGIFFAEIFLVGEDVAVWARADGAFEVKGLGIECPVDFEKDDVGLHFFFDCADFPIAEWLTGGELWPDEAAVFFEAGYEAVEGFGGCEAD